MGNYLACVAPVHQSRSATVVHAVKDEITEIYEPKKAAELMLEHPGYFVCHSNSVKSGQRLAPLSADQELRFAQVYFLFPMHRLHTLVSAQERNYLIKVLSSSKTGRCFKQSNSKVSPLRMNLYAAVKAEGKRQSTAETSVSSYRTARSFSVRLNSLTQDVELSSQMAMAKSRSWRPNLQTINEISLLKA